MLENAGWKDHYGLIHHVQNPNPMSSENCPLFTALYLTLKKELGVDVREEAASALCALHNNGVFINYAVDHLKTHKKQLPENISHDNLLGIVSLQRLAKHPYDFYWDTRAMKHPVKLSLFLWLWATDPEDKWRLITTPLLLPMFFLWLLATTYSMTRTVKVRPNGTWPATDNKNLTYLATVACNMPLVYKWCSLILKFNSRIPSFYDSLIMYFAEGHTPVSKHPVQLMAKALKENNIWDINLESFGEL